MKHALKLIALALLFAGGATQSHAATQDYRFELTDQTVKMGHDVQINVRLVNSATNKPVTDATITEQKLVMLMGGTTMPSQVKALPADANGNYSFVSDLTMAGNWQLDLSAQVPSEKDPVHGFVKFQVVK